MQHIEVTPEKIEVFYEISNRIYIAIEQELNKIFPEDSIQHKINILFSIFLLDFFNSLERAGIQDRRIALANFFDALTMSMVRQYNETNKNLN